MIVSGLTKFNGSYKLNKIRKTNTLDILYKYYTYYSILYNKSRFRKLL